MLNGFTNRLQRTTDPLICFRPAGLACTQIQDTVSSPSWQNTQDRRHENYFYGRHSHTLIQQLQERHIPWTRELYSQVLSYSREFCPLALMPKRYWKYMKPVSSSSMVLYNCHHHVASHFTPRARHVCYMKYLVVLNLHLCMLKQKTFNINIVYFDINQVRLHLST